MNINDPIGDMITRIRNAHLRGKDTVDSPSSNLRINILEVLKDEGFISCLLYTSPSPRDGLLSRMPSSA